MNPLDMAKDIAAVIKKAGDIELYRQIVELQGELVKLSTRNFELEADNSKLKAELNQKRNLKHLRGLYGMDGDPIPFCPICHERDGKLIHLGSLHSPKPGWQAWSCHTCYHNFYAQNATGEFRAQIDKWRLRDSGLDKR